MIAQTDRLYQEGLRKKFDIVSDFEDRRGVFSEEAGMPPLPDEIVESGGVINFILTGPLAQAQRLIFELTPINNTIASFGPAVDLLGEEMLDVFNKDELSELLIEAGSFPQGAINSRQKREEIRQARAEKESRERQELLAIEAAKAAPGISKNIEPDSVLAQAV